MKIWGRNDYQDVHQQVIGYWTDGVEALATVMITDRQDPDWHEDFAAKCLQGKTATHEVHGEDTLTCPSHHFVARSEGGACEVDHLPLQLAKRT